MECEILGTVENRKAFKGGEKGSLGKIKIPAVAICSLKQSFLFPSLHDNIKRE